MRQGIYIMLICIILMLFSEVEARDIIHGSLARFQNGAIVDVSAVFSEIPEYQAIEDRGLTTEDADYYILLAAANDKFYSAIRSVARRRGYDMVARRGAPAVANLNLPDITDDVIDIVSGNN